LTRLLVLSEAMAHSMKTMQNRIKDAVKGNSG